MATVEAPPIPGEQRFLLPGISWDTYQALSNDLEGRRIRLTFNEGDLEIMVTGALHEYFREFLGSIVSHIVFILDIPARSGGSMTFQRQDLVKGFEPDKCWWIAHEHEVRGKREFDFANDPAPDLAIEVEITSSLTNRVGIYAALGIREIWRFDGETLRFCVLQDDGSYQTRETSLAFPFLRPEHLTPFLQLDDTVDETTRLKQFVEWFEEQGFSA